MKISNFYLILIATLLFSACAEDKKLPIYGHREAKEVKQPDGSITVDTIYQTIPNWAFLNQDSILINQDKFNNKVYIADFFFTSCSTICPEMHRNMKTIFDAYKDNDDVMFLSHTIDFKYDKPSVLKRYATKFGVDGPKWQFVYGNKADVYTLAEKNYLVVVDEDSTERDGYIHQGYLVLVDKEKRIRGAYDGTDKEQTAQLQKDLAILLKEYKK